MADTPISRFKLANPGRMTRRRLPRILPPDRAERTYARELNKHLAALEQRVMPGLEPVLERAVAQFNQLTPDRADSWASDIAVYLSRQQLAFGQGVEPPRETTAGIARMVSALNKAEINKLMRSAFGVNLIESEPWLSGMVDSFSESNVELIKSLTSETFSRIENITQAGVRAGKPVREISQELQAQFKVSRSRANLIARDQVSKLNSNITELRQRQLGVKEYIWRTSNDERVRETHRAHNGKTFAWSDPPANTGHPGQDYQCRCWAEPVLEDV